MEFDSPAVETCVKPAPQPEPHPTNHFLLDIARKYNFRFLDNFPIYYERGDLVLHRHLVGGLDCSYHCYTPETVRPEFVLLTQMIDV